MGTVSDLEVQRRKDMARVVVQVMGDWGLSARDQAALLGARDNTPGPLIKRFEAGLEERAEAQLLQRISALLTIHKALTQMHPQSVEMADYWVTTPHPYFNDRPPLDVMLREGPDGMQRVVEHLNGRGEWG